MNGFEELEALDNSDDASPQKTHEEIVANNEEQTSSIVKSNVKATRNINPDSRAEAQRLSKKLNLPAAFVERNMDDIKQGIAEQSIDYDGLASDNPASSRWLRNPENAAISRDDIENVQKIENQTKRFKPYKDNHYASDMVGAAGIGLDRLQVSVTQLGMAWGTVDLQEGAEYIADKQKKMAEHQGALPEYANRFNEMMEKESGDVNRASQEFISSYKDMRDEFTVDALIRFGEGGFETVAETLDFISESAQRPAGLARAVSENLAFSLPALAGSAVLAPLGATGLVLGGFIGGSASEVGATMSDVLADNGVDLTNPQQLKKAFQDPDLMARVRNESYKKGLTTAAVDSMMNLFAGRVSVGSGKVGKVASGVADVGVQSVGEGVSEAAGQLARYDGDFSKVDYGEAVFEGIASVGQSAATSALGAAVVSAKKRASKDKDSSITPEPPSPPAKAQKLAVDTGNALEVLAGAESMQALGDTVRESKVGERNPEAVGELVDESSEDGDSVVYFQADEWNSVWSKHEQSPIDAAKGVMGEGAEKAYRDSVEVGTPMAIKVSDLLKVSDEATYNELIGVGRKTPDGMNATEASEFMDALPSEMDKLAKEAVEYKDKQEQIKTEAREIKEEIAEQIKTAREAGVAVDPKQAVIFSEFFKSAAIRYGSTPREIADKFGLRITVDEKSETTGEELEQANKKENKFKQDQRAELRISPNGKMTLNLFSGKSDPSSLFHEGGHFFLEAMGHLAETMDDAGLKEDYNQVLKWLGVDSTSKIKRKHHEKFATGFEKYITEGVAPSRSLKKAFNLFKQFMLSVYRDIRNIKAKAGNKEFDVKLNDNIRAVFDRMLAAEAATNEAAASVESLFEDPIAAGMGEVEAEQYKQLVEDAHNKSKEEIRKKLFDQLEGKRTKAYKEAKEVVTEVVTEEINELPVFKALDVFRNPDNPGHLKLDKQTLLDAGIDQKTLNKLPQQPRIYTLDKKGGYSAVMAADAFGYPDVFTMINEIQTYGKKKQQMIDMEVESRMQKKFPELLESPEISEAGVEAYHTDKRAAVLRSELKFLASNNLSKLKGLVKKVARRPPPIKAVKEQAIVTIGNIPVGSLRPNTYRLSERRAAKQAGEMLAKGDIEGAFDQKLKELMNHELYRAAVAAKRDIAKSTKQQKKVWQADKKIVKSRDINYVNAARAILADFGLGRSDKSAMEYLDTMAKYDEDVFRTVEDMVKGATDAAAPVDQISYSDFKAMHDVVMSLWDLAKSSQEIEVDGVKRNRTEIAKELAAAAREFIKKKPDGFLRSTKGPIDDATRSLLSFEAYVSRYEHWIDEMDLGDPEGIFRKYLFTNVSEGTDIRIDKKAEYNKEFNELLKTVDFTTPPVNAPEINFQFITKGQLLYALLHTGNPSNFKKLLVGWGWGTLLEDGSLDTTAWDKFIARAWSEGLLAKADYDFVQSIWNITERMKPDAQRAHKKILGFHFNEITAERFQTPWGVYEGGYVPAKVDRFEVRDVGSKEAADEFINGHSAFAWPGSGGKGFGINRNENFNKPLDLDMKAFGRHIDEVLNFIYIKPAVIDVAKIIDDQEFKDAMNDLNSEVIGGLIKPALIRADKNRLQQTEGTVGSVMNNAARTLKNRSAMQIMFGNVQNVVEQVSGLITVFNETEPKYVMDAAVKWFKDGRTMTDAIAVKSLAMKARFDNQVFDVSQIMEVVTRDVITDDDIKILAVNNPRIAKVAGGVQAISDLIESTKYGSMKRWAALHSYYFQIQLQNIMDTAAWTAHYNQSLVRGLDDKGAIRAADSLVRRSQSSSRPIDVSRIETNAFLSIFQMFMGWFNNMGNFSKAGVRKIVRSDMRLGKKVQKGFMLYMLSIYSLSVFSDLVKRGLSGSLDADDDDEYSDDLFDIFVYGQFRMMAAMFPVVGQATMAGLNRANDKWYDDRVSASPAINAITTTVAAPIEVGKVIGGKENKKQAVRDVFTATGMLLGIPLGPLAKPIVYGLDVHSGKAKPKGPVDFTRGLVSGKPGKK